MASLNLTRPPAAGQAQAFTAAAAGGDSFPLPAPIVVKVNNTSGATRTVTVVAQRPCNQGFTHNATVSCPTGVITEFPVSDVMRFQDGNARVQLTYDSATGVSVAAYAT